MGRPGRLARGGRGAAHAEGKIRFFGVSINDHQPDNALRLIESGAVDTVQVIYNVFDQSPEDELFPACREHGVGVIARVPLDEGGLTGTIGPDTEFPEGDFRAHYFGGDRKREVARARARDPADLGIGAERAGRDRAALRPERADRLHGDPRHALGAQRRAQHRGLGRARRCPTAGAQQLRAHRWVRNFYE